MLIELAVSLNWEVGILGNSLQVKKIDARVSMKEICEAMYIYE